MEEMEHLNERNIKCPYCNWEDNDSWEMQDYSDMRTCGDCGKEFNVERNIEITYSTFRINCEESDGDHNYQFDCVFKSKRKFSKGVWYDLTESEWTYHRIMMCSVCGDKRYDDITKDQYIRMTTGE